MLTYGRDGLHAQYKRILGEVARVRERVLLPELAKEILLVAHASKIVGKISFKKQMYASA